MLKKIRVWDLPTRIFHWALLLCVTGSAITAQIGGNAMAWHFRCGYAILSLLLFRLIWGVIGGHWSRFSSFIYSPSTLVRYLRGRGEPEHSVGHSPSGALSVFALLLLLLVQVVTGLTSDDEIASAGPWVRCVANSWVSKATYYHANVGKLLLIGLVVLHIAAIAFTYFKKHDDLIRPMIFGDKHLPTTAVNSRDDLTIRVGAAAVLLACIGAVGLLVWLTL
jgi:cytochrome b